MYYNDFIVIHSKVKVMARKREEVPQPLEFNVDEYREKLAEKGYQPLPEVQASLVKLVYCREDEWPYLTALGTVWLYDASKKTQNLRPLASVQV